MLSAVQQARIFEKFINEAKSFVGVFEAHTLQLFWINSAGLTMLILDSIDDYAQHYPVGFWKEPIDVADFQAQFLLILTQGPWSDRVECRQHTGQTFWTWMRMSITDIDGQFFLLVRATDSIFLNEMNQAMPVQMPGNSPELSQLVEQRTATLLDTLHELEAAKQALEESLAQERTQSLRRSAFITAISHEFRTPLAILQTSAALMPRLAKWPDKQQHHAEVIQEQVLHLAGMLNSLIQQTLHDEADLTAEVVSQTANTLKITHNNGYAKTAAH